MPFDKKISVVKPCTSLLFTNWDKLEHSRTLFNFTLMQYCIYHKSFSVFPVHSLFRSFDTSMTVFFLFPTELLTKTRKLWKFHNFSPCFFGEFRYYCMAYGICLLYFARVASSEMDFGLLSLAEVGWWRWGLKGIAALLGLCWLHLAC